MGYRSDVQIVIRGPEEEMLSLWAEFRFKNPWKGTEEDPLLRDLSLTKHDQDVVICFEADQWKWYDGYEDVYRVNNLWAFFHRGEDSFVKGAFVRLGEDDADVVTEYFGDDAYELARVTRSIDCEYSVDRENDIRSKI